MNASRKLLVASLGLLSLVGCVPRIAITTYAPAKYNLGRANQLSLVQSEGRRSAREFVLAEIASQGRAAGRFTVRDRSEEGITVKVAGRIVQVSGGSGAPQGEQEIGLRVDVLEWGATPNTTSSTDRNGKTTSTTMLTGKVMLGVTAFNAAGKAILAETEYPGRFELAQNGTSEDMVIQAAARMAVAQLLADITPVAQTRQVELDNSEEAYKPILETVKAGAMEKAMQDARDYVAKNNSGPANYNLAVFLDAAGKYEEALATHDKAIALGSKPLYVNARAACAKRLQDAKALME
jgi:hypothetical protein